MKSLIELCKQKNISIATAESCTAGLFASMLGEVSGASQVFVGGIVTYATRIKTEVLHVNDSLIEQYGVVSQQVADEMALCAQKMFHSDLAVSFTGNAGPSVCDDKPVGCIYASVAYKDQLYSYHLQLAGDRNEIRQQACFIIKNKCIEILS